MNIEVSLLNSVESPQLVRKTISLNELEALPQASNSSQTGVFLKITPKKRKTTDSSSDV